MSTSWHKEQRERIIKLYLGELPDDSVQAQRARERQELQEAAQRRTALLEEAKCAQEGIEETIKELLLERGFEKPKGSGFYFEPGGRGMAGFEPLGWDTADIPFYIVAREGKREKIHRLLVKHRQKQEEFMGMELIIASALPITALAFANMKASQLGIHPLHLSGMQAYLGPCLAWGVCALTAVALPYTETGKQLITRYRRQSTHRKLEKHSEEIHLGSYALVKALVS